MAQVCDRPYSPARPRPPPLMAQVCDRP